MTPDVVQVRILRRPGTFSHLVPGDLVYWTKDYAARAVGVGAAEYVKTGPKPISPPEPQVVEPAVEVLGCPEPAREVMRENYRKKRGKR